MKAKVIELVGVKLDPKAKYLILVDTYVPPETIQNIAYELNRHIGDNFTIGIVPDPQNAVKVFEFMPEETKALSDKEAK